MKETLLKIMQENILIGSFVAQKLGISILGPSFMQTDRILAEK
jgi:hypothetical protein